MLCVPYHTGAGRQEGSTTMTVTQHLLPLFTLVFSLNLNHTDTNSVRTRTHLGQRTVGGTDFWLGFTWLVCRTIPVRTSKRAQPP